jgi:hypothetical protein
MKATVTEKFEGYVYVKMEAETNVESMMLAMVTLDREYTTWASIHSQPRAEAAPTTNLNIGSLTFPAHEILQSDRR